jgi:F0F1-type ATP synthase assembly protein I
MTKLARNLSFCSVILNLALWAVLIKARHTDRRLLLISGGLGVQMAGKAIGHSLRQVSASTVLAGNLVYVLSHLACMYIWWQAFRHSTVTQESRERLQDL